MDPNLTFTPVDHDPFAEAEDFAKNLPPSQLPGDVHTTSFSGVPTPGPSFHDIAGNPNNPMAARVAAIPGAIAENAVKGAVTAPLWFGDQLKQGWNPTDPEAIAAAVPGSTELAANLAAPALTTEAGDPSVIGTFAGPNAATADLGKLNTAKQLLESATVSPEQIRKLTGWEQRPDGNWHFEISDDTARLTPGAYNTLKGQFENYPDIYANTPVTISGKMSDIIAHPDLYAAYPQLGDIQTTVNYHPNYRASSGAYTPYWNGKDPTIDLSVNNLHTMYKDNPLDVGMHELQHGIQQIEGFSPGGNPDMFMPQGHFTDADEWDNARNQAFNTYQSLYGEAESRNVQRRRMYTPYLRQAVAPERTMDVPQSQQLFMNPMPRWTTTPVDHNPFDTEFEDPNSKE